MTPQAAGLNHLGVQSPQVCWKVEHNQHITPVKHAQTGDSSALLNSCNIAVASTMEAWWLTDQNEYGCVTLLQVAALEAENARLTRRNQPEASRHQVRGHLTEAVLLLLRDVCLLCGSSTITAEQAEMHVAQNCCAVGLMGPGRHADEHCGRSNAYNQLTKGLPAGGPSV